MTTLASKKPNPAAKQRAAKKTPISGDVAAQLTQKEKLFVEAKLNNLSDFEAAKATGSYAHPTVFANSDTVKASIAAARRWLTDMSQITRLDILEGMIDAIEMARHLGDPATMLKGWGDIAKYLGYAAPEAKGNVLNLTVNQMNIQSKMESLPMEDLLRIADGTYQSQPNQQGG